MAGLRAQLEVAGDDDLVREERQWWDAPDHRSPVFRLTDGGTRPFRPA